MGGAVTRPAPWRLFALAASFALHGAAALLLARPFPAPPPPPTALLVTMLAPPAPPTNANATPARPAPPSGGQSARNPKPAHTPAHAAPVRPPIIRTATGTRPQPVAPQPVAQPATAPQGPAPLDAAPAQPPATGEGSGQSGATIAPGYLLGAQFTPAPAYPWSARRRGLQGRVLIRLEVADDGHPLKLEVIRSSGHDSLDQAALDTLRRWRLRPATVDGVPVSGSVVVPILFRLS